MANIADLFGRLLLDDSGFEAAVVKSAQSAGDKGGASLGASLAKSLKTAGLASLGAVFTATAAGAVQLDTAVKQFSADVGATAEETDKARAAAIDLFKTNRQGYSEILQTLAKLHSDQGLTIDDADRLAENYLKFAKVAGGTAPAAVKSLDDVQDAWNLTADRGVSLMDQLVASNQKYGGSLQQRVSDLTSLAPALQALNLTVDDAIGLENVFAASGIETSDVLRGLNTAVKNLKPGETLQSLIDQVSSIEDPTKRAQKAMEIFGPRVGAAIAQAFGPDKAKQISDFIITTDQAGPAVKRASDLIDSSIPARFQLFLKDLQGTLIEIAEPVGPVVTATAGLVQLGIAAKGAGIASAAATPGVAGLGAAAGVTSLSLAPLIAIFGVAVVGGLALQAAMEGIADVTAPKFTAALGSTADQIEVLRRRQANLQAEITNGTIPAGASIESVTAAVARLGVEIAALENRLGTETGAFNTLDTAGRGAATAIDAVGDAAARANPPIDKVVLSAETLAASAGGLSAGQIAVAEATLAAGRAHSQLSDAQKAAADAAEGDVTAVMNLARAQVADAVASARLKAAQDALVKSAEDIPPAMLGAGHGTDEASDAALRLANNAKLAAGQLGLLGQAAFKLGTVNINGENLLPGGMSLGESFLEDLLQDQRNLEAAAARERERIAGIKRLQDEAASAAKEHARTVQGQMADAFRAAKSSADAFFDALHRRRLADIEDERARVNAELEAQKKALFEGVDAAQAALDAKRQAEQRKGLQRDVTQAALGIQAAGEDPQAIADAVARLREARQALADFDAQANIDADRTAAQATADQLTAAQKANDDKAALAVEGENKTSAARQKAFDDGLAKLEDQLLTEKGSHAKTLAAIAKLYVDAGISSKSQGAQIALGLAAGLLSEIKAVESAAKTLAAAVAKYIKVGSPAEAGPFHDDPPEAMGKRLAAEFGKGVTGGLQGINLDEVLKGLAGDLQLPGLAPAAATAGTGTAPVATGGFDLGGLVRKLSDQLAAAMPKMTLPTPMLPSLTPAFAIAGPIAPSAPAAAVPNLAPGNGLADMLDGMELHARFDLGGNQFTDAIARNLAWRRRST